jgi:hypothetical protein
MTLIEQYKNVIADLAQDIGYVEGAQETALSVLKGRLHELEEVHPKIFDQSVDEMLSWIPKIVTDTKE